MKKDFSKKALAAIVLSGVFMIGAFAGGTTISAILRPDIKVVIDGTTQTFKDAGGTTVYPISYNNTTYLPIRAIGGIMGKEVGWDQATQTITLGTGAVTGGDTGTYSRTNPAPVGTQQTVKVDSYSGKFTAAVTVMETVRGDSAWEKIKAANRFNSAAKDGKEYVLAKIKATVIESEDDKAVDFNSSSFDAYSSTNVEYADFFSVVEPTPEFDGNVFKDGTLEGYVAFMVDKTDSAPKIVFGASYDGTGGIWFALTK